MNRRKRIEAFKLMPKEDVVKIRGLMAKQRESNDVILLHVEEHFQQLRRVKKRIEKVMKECRRTKRPQGAIEMDYGDMVVAASAMTVVVALLQQQMFEKEMLEAEFS